MATHWVDHFRFAIWKRFDNGYVEELQTLANGTILRDLYYLEVPKDEWRYFGFMNFLGIATCRVSESLIRDNEDNVPNIQKTYYR